MDLRNAEEIVRRETIPKRHRTEERDACADWIEDNIVETARWPMEYSAIAEESRWSRQHVSQVLKEYFRPASDGKSLDDLDESDLLEAYRMGYRDGQQDAMDFLR